MSWGQRVRAVGKALVPKGLIYSTYEQRLLRNLDRERLPRHVAVLADGNRRWARVNAPGQELVVGYRAGADKLREFVGWCDEVGIRVVTLWVLSTENLRRAEAEELKDHARAELKLALGDRTSARCSLGKVTYSPHERESIDSKALRKDMPEVAAKYTRTTVVRPMRLYPEKTR